LQEGDDGNQLTQKILPKACGNRTRAKKENGTDFWVGRKRKKPELFKGEKGRSEPPRKVKAGSGISSWTATEGR